VIILKSRNEISIHAASRVVNHFKSVTVNVKVRFRVSIRIRVSVNG